MLAASSFFCSVFAKYIDTFLKGCELSMTDQKTAEAVLKKYDRESNTAHYTGLPQKVIAAAPPHRRSGLDPAA